MTCIGKGLSLQHGGAVYNFTGPQAFELLLTAVTPFMRCRRMSLRIKNLPWLQLKDALDHNFGCGCCETASDDEARIYEAVKRILSSNGSIDVSALQSQLSASQTANAGDREYARIKRIMENTTWYGNDVDDVDLLARRCGQIYST